MGMRTVNDPYGDPSVLVDTVFGTSYDAVRHVANNIDFVKKVANLFDTSETIVANIHQRYVSAEGQNEFELPVPVVSEAFVTVFVNGKWRSPSVTYSATDTTLLFNQALDEGDVVDAMIVSGETLYVLEQLKEEAEQYENRAREWAEAPEDTEVEPGQYSARHHSAKASAQRLLAQTARLEAEQAADTANTAAGTVTGISDNIRKLNTEATRAPLPTDDETQGYAAGSRWMWQGQEWVFDGARWIRNPVINAQAFGDLTAADARPAIEAAMAFAAAISPLGSVVELPAGIINVGWSGELVRGRRLGIRARSNVTLRGQGPATVLRVADGSNIDLIASDRWPGGSENVVANFHVEDMTLDGNADNQNPANLEGWNLCLWGFKDCGVKNVRSINPNTWGVRLEHGDGLILRDIVTRHGPATNSDGIHLVDVDNVVGGGLDVLSEGDDAFIIEATNKAEIHNYAIAGLLVKASLTGSPAGARGCMLLVDEDVRPDLRRGMRNIAISGLVATNCIGPGIVLIGGDFDGVNIQGVADGCGVGLALIPGNPNHTGEIKGCSFDIDITRSTGQSAYVATANGTVVDNHIRLGVIASAATVVPVQMAGSRWNGEIAVRHLATATLPAYAVSVATSSSALSISTAGCAGGLILQGTAVNNSIMPGVLRADGGGNAVNVAGGAAGNTFHGGKVVGPVVNNASAKFFGVAGAENYNAQEVTTDVNGVATISHGLQGIPLSVVLTPHSIGVASLRISGRTATNFSLAFRR